MIYSTANLIALGALLVMLLLSLRWVFGAPKPRKARSHDVVRGTQRADGTWDRAATRRRDER
jgi:hypothetical protein